VTIEVAGNIVVFEELLERKQVCGAVAFRVWRDGRETDVEVPLHATEDPFVYRNRYDRRPEYYIKGGLVFAPLSRELLRTLERSRGEPAAQQLSYYSEFAKLDNLYTNRHAFVVLLRRLPHPVNTYADPFINGIVEEANGAFVRDLPSLKAALREPAGKYHVLRFAGLHDKLVLDAQATDAAEEEIRSAYGIPEFESMGGPR
jgi:hypothetical protein